MIVANMAQRWTLLAQNKATIQSENNKWLHLTDFRHLREEFLLGSAVDLTEHKKNRK